MDPADRLAKRLDHVRRLIRQADVSALLVTKGVNVRYLTGFTGEDSYLLLTDRDAIVVSDMRFATQLADECPGYELEIRAVGVSLAECVTRLINRLAIPRLALEADALSVALYELFAAKIQMTQLRPCSGMVEQLREIKDRGEVQEIRRAVQVAQRAFQVVRAQMTPDQTEQLAAAELEYQIRKFGGEGCSFPPIVAVGPRAALPHARPSERRIAASDFVLIDWGARAAGYASDLTRVLVTGKISPKLQRVYGVVLTAQSRAIAAIRPGMPVCDVDAAARAVIADAGFGKYFGHGLGHGIGLEIHEAPRLAVGQSQRLRPGMVVTVEPGIYLPGWGGVRIEDDVLVTRDGHEVLTDVPKELECCVVR
jgi:Xaa-Pro aminopeptidase